MTSRMLQQASIAHGFSQDRVFLGFPDNTEWTLRRIIHTHRSAAVPDPRTSVVVRLPGKFVEVAVDTDFWFDASASYDTNGVALVRFEWDLLGEGYFGLLNFEPFVRVNYSSLGRFNAVLRVTNANGTMGFNHFTVDVTRDGDRLPDDQDNCPDVYNPSQSDKDGNGVGDACEPGSPIASRRSAPPNIPKAEAWYSPRQGEGVLWFYVASVGHIPHCGLVPAFIQRCNTRHAHDNHPVPAVCSTTWATPLRFPTNKPTHFPRHLHGRHCGYHAPQRFVRGCSCKRRK